MFTQTYPHITYIGVWWYDKVYHHKNFFPLQIQSKYTNSTLATQAHLKHLLHLKF